MFRTILNKYSLDHNGDKLVSFFCTNCVVGKNHKLSFASSTSSVSTSLKLIHCDVGVHLQSLLSVVTSSTC